MFKILSFSKKCSLFADSNDIFSRLEHRSYKKLSLSIEKRNVRERNRVRAINSAFQSLQLTIPSISTQNKRISKVKILMRAINYIKELETLLYLDSLS